MPAGLLALVCWRLVDRLAENEIDDRIRNSEAAPWYYEEKMNHALEAHAVHVARMVGYERLVNSAESPRPDLFEILRIDRGTHPAGTAGRALATGTDNLVALTDDDGRPVGTLLYRYSEAGLRKVLADALDDLRAPWNDDSVQIFLAGATSRDLSQGYDLNLRVRVDDPMIHEQLGRTEDIRFASKVTGHGFSVELAIPWRHVGVPQLGKTFRFDLINNDNDHVGAYGPRNGLTIWAGSERNWADRSGLGLLRLEDKEAASGEREAIALPARGPIAIDGDLSESDWLLANQAQKRDGQTDNVVRWGAAWNAEDLFIGVDVTDGQVVNHQSHEEVDWVLRINDGKGQVLLDTAADAGKVLALPGSRDIAHTIALGPLKGSRILLAFRDRPFTRRVQRWKTGLIALLTATSGLLGFGLWLVFAGVKRHMDLVALKSRFIATVSHEFKAPLAVLRASAEILGQGRAADPEKRARYEGIIESESRRLASLVDSVLSVSRIDEGRRYQFAPLDVGSVVEAALDQHRLSLEEGRFEVTTAIAAGLPPVQADVAAVQEALSILIDNAVKYSGERRECRVEARAQDGGVAISVADRGFGVPPQDQRRIFDRFNRGESDGHGETGSGLGLSIAREIARAHGGDILLQSEPGRGSIFTLILPQVAPQ